MEERVPLFDTPANEKDHNEKDQSIQALLESYKPDCVPPGPAPGFDRPAGLPGGSMGMGMLTIEQIKELEKNAKEAAPVPRNAADATFCTVCGAKRAEGARFCQECGTIYG